MVFFEGGCVVLFGVLMGRLFGCTHVKGLFDPWAISRVGIDGRDNALLWALFFEH